MVTTLWFIAFLVYGLVWHLLAFAQTNPLPDALSNPKFLAARTWKIDKGLESIVKVWPTYTGDQGFADKTVLNSTEVNLLGIILTAEYRVSKGDLLAEIVLLGTHLGKQSGEDCPTFLSWGTQNLGKPSKALDLSKMGQDDGIVHMRADWLLGQSRVRLTCSGIKLYGKWISPGLLAIMYTHKDRLPALEDLIYLDCSSTEKYTGNLADRRVEASAPLAFIIDPNDGRVLRRDGSLFLETKEFSNDQIVATKEEKETISNFRLDRLTGNYILNHCCLN